MIYVVKIGETMKTVLNLIRKNNASAFLRSSNRDAYVGNKTETSFYWLTAYGEPTIGVHYKAGEPDNSIERFVEKLRERYLPLQTISVDELTHFARACLIGNKTEYIKENIRTLVLWLSYFEAIEHHDPRVDYYITALQHGAITLSDHGKNETIKSGAARIAELGKELFQPDDRFNPSREFQFHLFYNCGLLVLTIAAEIEKSIGKAPDFSYLKSLQDPMDSLLQIGYTHNDLFRFMSPPGLTDETLAFIRKKANGDFIREAIEHAYTHFSLEYYVAGKSEPNPMVVQGKGINPVLMSLHHNREEFNKAVRYFFPENDSPKSKDFELLDLYGMMRAVPKLNSNQISIFCWVLRHRQWFDGFTDIESSKTGEVMSVHNHTLVEIMLRVAGTFEDKALENLEPTDNFRVVEFIFREEFIAYVDKSISDRIYFDEPEIKLEPFTVSNGEQISFEFIPNSVALSNEGKLMHHCVGGYATAINENNLIYHIHSSEDAHGYTMHLTRLTNDSKFYISQVRGRYNASLPTLTHAELHQYISTTQEKVNVVSI